MIETKIVRALIGGTSRAVTMTCQSLLFVLNPGNIMRFQGFRTRLIVIQQWNTSDHESR